MIPYLNGYTHIALMILVVPIAIGGFIKVVNIFARCFEEERNLKRLNKWGANMKGGADEQKNYKPGA